MKATRPPATRAMAPLAVIALTGLVVVGSAHAQSAAKAFPADKPITLIVPYAAGGTVDACARLMASRLEEELSTRVQVVNRPGAASQTALAGLVNTPPEGTPCRMPCSPR